MLANFNLTRFSLYRTRNAFVEEVGNASQLLPLLLRQSLIKTGVALSTLVLGASVRIAHCCLIFIVCKHGRQEHLLQGRPIFSFEKGSWKGWGRSLPTKSTSLSGWSILGELQTFLNPFSTLFQTLTQPRVLHGVNLDVFSIGSQCFAFSEPASAWVDTVCLWK